MTNRQFVAVLIKNIIKKAYGQHDFTHYEDQRKREDESVPGDENDPRTFIDLPSLQLIQQHLVNLTMGCSENLI